MTEPNGPSFHSIAARYLIKNAVQEVQAKLPLNIPEFRMDMPGLSLATPNVLVGVEPTSETAPPDIPRGSSSAPGTPVDMVSRDFVVRSPPVDIPAPSSYPFNVFDPFLSGKSVRSASEELEVCIIGAGIAGLRTASFLDYLGIKYTIFEASLRPGGRVFTHHFGERKTKKSAASGQIDSATIETIDHNYYDVGAMRFPRTKVLELTFKLFEELEIIEGRELIPYIMSNPKNIGLYNGHRITKGELKSAADPYGDRGYVPEGYLKHSFTKRDKTPVTGVAALVAEVLEPFKVGLADDFKEGWENLMNYDHYSTREYLLQIKKYPMSVVQWMERTDGSTGAYDLAFTEKVLGSMDFDYPFKQGENPHPNKEQEWFCVDGGSSVIINRIVKRLSNQPNYNQRVTGIRMEDRLLGSPKMFVRLQGRSSYEGKHYSHIIASAPLSCLSSMDLAQAGLGYIQKQAIRTLGYGTAIKIGIKFKTRWWQKPGSEQRGGVSNTDRPVRVVVYPSYGIDDPEDESGVLIASYAWSQDAERLGAHMKGEDSKFKGEKFLLDIVFRDLAEMHGKTPEWYEEQYEDHYAHDWSRDEFAVGASAFFRPGQFNQFYPEITKPAAKGNLHFVGEACSTHHAWIEGALASAWRSVFHLLFKEQEYALLEKFANKWPPPAEIDIYYESLQVMRAIFGL